jgi:hypothetical protein
VTDPVGPWMQLYSGEPFAPAEATPDQIHITDIAHALGMVCRYAGHCRRFYSVAEHSVLLSHTVDPEHALWALLHDATEAYIGDIVRPLKHQMPGYLATEARLALVVAIKFGLPGAIPEQVVEHDTRIVVDERQALMSPCRLPWPMIEEYAPLGVTITGWDPTTATGKFLDRYRQLNENRRNVCP